MLKSKFQGKLTSGSREDALRRFLSLWAWQPGCSCDQTIFIDFMLSSKEGSTSNLALIGHVVSEIKIFEYNGYVHVYSPLAGADKPLGSILFSKYYKCSVTLAIC